MDRGEHLKLVDPEHNLKYPSPPDLDRWLGHPKQFERGYRVYARLPPDVSLREIKAVERDCI